MHRCKPCDKARDRREYRREYAREYMPVYKRQRRTSDPLYKRLELGLAKARKLGAPFEIFTSTDLRTYWQANGIDPTRCYYTGEELGPDFHLDHMTPQSRGGSHSMSNLVPCTPAANVIKGTRTAEEYLDREAIPA